jgi:Sec-independent protein translocase protein TatA
MLFGAKRLPEMGRSLGGGMREFRDGVMGREPSAPAQGALEPPADSVNRSRAGERIG